MNQSLHVNESKSSYIRLVLTIAVQGLCIMNYIELLATKIKLEFPGISPKELKWRVDRAKHLVEINNFKNETYRKEFNHVVVK